MSLNKRLAERIRQGRQELGLSQFELGVLAKIDEATAKSRISHYETGFNIPTLKTLEQLALAMNVPVSWFFCEDDEVELITLLHRQSSEERHKTIQAILGAIKDELF